MSTDQNANTRNPKVKKHFTKVPNQIIAGPELSYMERPIVAYILKFDQCFVAQETMAKELGCSKSTIQRNIASLLKKNVIRKVNSFEHRHRCYYVVNRSDAWSVEGIE